LPPEPETGPEAIEPETVEPEVAPEDDEFDAFLEGAQERFGEAGQSPEPIEEEPEPLEPEAAASQSEAQDGGPTDLRPRSLEPVEDPASEDSPE